MPDAPDLVIAGGGTGGCAAALAACRVGLRVVMTEECRWIGGQFTSQGVPPDEHGWIERFGCTASYRAFREGVRAFYRSWYPLSEAARRDPRLNPGNGWVSPLCHEPAVAHAVLCAMLAPYETAGRLRILRRHRPIAADAEHDRLRAVTFEDLDTGARTTFEAPWFLDATEMGDLLPLAGAEFVTGAESAAETGEPSAPAQAHPSNVQAFSWCFAIDHREGEDHTIPRPARYDYWRDYVPQLTPPWPGRLLSWRVPNPRTMQPGEYRFEPHREQARAFSGLWSYRRLLDRSNFTPGFLDSDVRLVNWPQIDYLASDQSPEGARQLSLCAFYWMQTEAPRPDGGLGWPGLRLRGDVLGTPDGLAQHAYIRESRRIRAIKTVTEQDVSAACLPGRTLAAPQRDSTGIGSYRIDLHPSSGGDNYIDVPALPFQIPLGALVPVRLRNLLPAAKNIGTTHITNGCFRLHPVEWNIGEAAGLLVAFAREYRIDPQQAPAHIDDFQRLLIAQGVELAWPDNLNLAEGDPHIHAISGTRST